MKSKIDDRSAIRAYSRMNLLRNAFNQERVVAAALTSAAPAPEDSGSDG
ncbi:MAG: hypothetical protein M3323_03970 [Actinomycetota bacterium]|nr:hypothetical protein [Actinomycetota bacterium]